MEERAKRWFAQEGRRPSTVKVPVNIQVEFRRVAKTKHGPPGKGHVILNGVAMCPPHSWPWEYGEGAVERITLEQFADYACKNCEGMLNADKAPGQT
jgi:hypothetical protein